MSLTFDQPIDRTSASQSPQSSDEMVESYRALMKRKGYLSAGLTQDDLEKLFELKFLGSRPSSLKGSPKSPCTATTTADNALPAP